jgi:hypothetical protein
VIVVHRTNAMPHPDDTRPPTRYEIVLLLTRGMRYRYDRAALAELCGGARPGDMWTMPTTPSRDGHPAVMSLELARRCVVVAARPRACT